MQQKILLLGHAKKAGLELVNLLLAWGYEPVATAWETFAPRTYGRQRPLMVIADIDNPAARPMTEIAPMVRKLWGQDYPLIAMSESTRFVEVEELLEAGVTDVVKKGSPARLIEKKIARWLAADAAAGGGPKDKKQEAEIKRLPSLDDLPPGLISLFRKNPRLARLGDSVQVFPGATPRAASSRRLAPPDGDWRGVVTGAKLERFHVGGPGEYLHWSRYRLFRMPAAGEYSVPEKVLLSRAGPPLTAAVDRSRSPAGGDVYSLVPDMGAGMRAGFLACILNSRLLDFYFNRLASGIDGWLRPDAIRDVPLPRPESRVVREMEQIAAMLTHYGPHPESWVDRQSRDEWRERLERAVLDAYGVGRAEMEGLAALHFLKAS